MTSTRSFACIPWLFLLAWLSCAFAAQAAPTLTAEIDRARITADDTVTLTLRLNESGNHSPDFSALQKDFSIIGESSGSTMSARLGHIEMATEWHLTLAPLRTGTLRIPAFTIGGATSQALRVLVQPAAQANASRRNQDADADDADDARAAATDDRPVFVEASVDRQSVYVQQQLLLTVRVYQAIALDDMHITDPEFDNATVRKLGQDKNQRDINGVSYQVHELSYAIFPQQAGELTIPELVFTAAEMRRARSLFDIGGRGRSVRALTKQITVKIKPVPSQFSGKVWLPARNLTLQETWGGNPATIHAGDSITRSIAVQADGVLASQLPAQEPPMLDHARLYADQPALNDQADASGLHGVRTDSAALIPAQAGALALPEVRVVWWDLDSDSEKVATIPAQTLTILPGTTAPSAPPPAASTDTASTAAAPSPSATPVELPRRAQQPWMIIAAGFALLWLITLVLFWRAQRQLRDRAAPTPATSNIPPRDDFAPLLDACKRSDACATSAALDRWLRTTFPMTPTADQWLRTLPAGDNTLSLSNAIGELQRALYCDETIQWNGQELAQALKNWRKQRQEISDKGNALPQLYPA